MHGKYSLTAAAVLMNGPNGPEYMPQLFTTEGAESMADAARAAGRAAIAVPVYLQMPEPGSLLTAPSLQLVGLVQSAGSPVAVADAPIQCGGRNDG